jgi:hypothetical protein
MNEPELWKDIIGYEGIYQISNYGNILSFQRYKKGKILKPKQDKDGYFQIGLRQNGQRKFFRVHRLVANAFIENPEGLTEINHKDCIPHNNHVDNLEWCTVSYNNKYRFSHGMANFKGENGSNATLTNSQASEIRLLWNTGNYKIKDLIILFSTTKGVIDGIINNYTYVDESYIKKYEGRLNCRGENAKSAKLTEEDVRNIRRLFLNGEMNKKQLARKYNVAPITIYNIILKKKWKHVE